MSRRANNWWAAIDFLLSQQMSKDNLQQEKVKCCTLTAIFHAHSAWEMNIFVNALWITHSETAPKGPYIQAQCAALGHQGQRSTTFQALKGRNILNLW